MTTNWTPTKVDEFATMIANGIPFRECGRLLKCSESAAIGKAFRLRNGGDDRFVVDVRESLRRRDGGKRRKRKSRAAPPKPPTPPAPPPPRPPVSRAKSAPMRIVWTDPRQLDLRIDPVGKRLWDLQSTECHYLIGSMDYCARPVPTGSNRPYCACHRSMMYRAAPRAA